MSDKSPSTMQVPENRILSAPIVAKSFAGIP